MAVVGGLAVDRAEQIELLDDVGRLEAENFAITARSIASSRHGVRAKGIDVHATPDRDDRWRRRIAFRNASQARPRRRSSPPNGPCKPRCDRLCSGLCRRTRRRRGAPAAVAIDDNFAAGQTGIALRSADDETSGRIDEKLRVLVRASFAGKTFRMTFSMQKFFDLAVLHVRRVLRGNDDVRDADRFAVFVNDGDLRLRVGAQPLRLCRSCECA